MSTFVTRFFLLTVFLFAAFSTPAVAEVIHLKNGRTIWADQVRQSDGKVEYDIGDNTYAVPASSVDKIESGGIAPAYANSSAGASAKEIPALALSDETNAFGYVPANIIQNGAVNQQALSDLEQTGDAKATALGYYVAGKSEYDRGRFPQSRALFEKALHWDSENPTILNYYAALLVRTGNAGEAMSFAERAVRLAPNSPDALAVLGYAQFASDRTSDAVNSWKHSLQLRPDAVVQQMLAKAQRESAVEASFSQNESAHFTFRYEGKQTSDTLRSQLVSLLESEYDDLVRQLGVAPHDSIPVVLYTSQAFFDVTQAPGWSGAVNDGKLRIPVQGVQNVNAELARVLKHELTHSFVNQLSGGRCPQWLNEGIAQAMEPKTVASRGNRLAELFRSQHEIPYNQLEGSFMRFSGAEALLAYDESLAAVEYINDTYGMSDLQRLLSLIGQGSSNESAMRTAIHSDYAQLDDEVGKYLIGKYGN